MATITEDARIITLNHFPYAPKYTYMVVTPTVSIEFDSLEKAQEWMPAIAVRQVSAEEARAHSINKFNSLKLTNPEFFKR
jgi:hypothetical protein